MPKPVTSGWPHLRRKARRGLDRFDAEMAHAGDDHAAFDAGLGLGARHAFAERVGVGLRRQPGLQRMVGRGEDLRIDGAVARQAGQIVVGEPRIVLFGAEQVGGEIIGGEEAGEIVPDEGAVLDEGRDVGAIFLRPAGSPARATPRLRYGSEVLLSEPYICPRCASPKRGPSSRACGRLDNSARYSDRLWSGRN